MTATETFSVDGVGGVRIVADRRGDPGARAVVFLHGGGQTRRSWGRAAGAVAQCGWQAVTVDFRGHGESGWAGDGDYSLASFAGDVLTVLGELPPQPVLVGASLGGFTSMLLAGELAPGSAGGVVLVDIVPDMDPMGATRVHNFMNDRMQSGFATLDEVADAIHKYNPNRARPTDLEGLRNNLRHRDGRWYWHWDPAFMSSGRSEVPGQDYQLLFEAALANIRVPTLLVVGKLSDVVTPEGTQEFLDKIPGAKHVDVSGASHMVAGDQNDQFATAVIDFLEHDVRPTLPI